MLVPLWGEKKSTDNGLELSLVTGKHLGKNDTLSCYHVAQIIFICKVSLAIQWFILIKDGKSSGVLE